jgi:ABC-2 type transport system ATP-binding protein
MEEAERLCDRLVIIDHGKIVADDTLDGLHRLVPAANLLTLDFADGLASRIPLAALRSLPGIESAVTNGHSLSIGLRNLAADSPAVLSWLASNDFPFQHLSSRRATLESVFLTLTGRSLRD